MELNKIYNMDCLEGMRLIPDKSVDMIICDLPYGVTGFRNAWDKILPVAKLWEQYKRIIKENCAIILTAVNPFASHLILSNIEMFKYEWVWEKDHGSNFANVKHQPFRVHELILVFSNGKITYTPKGGYLKYIPQMTDGKPHKKNEKSEKTSSVLASGKGYKRIDSGSHDGSRYPRSVQKFNREMGLHPTQKPVSLFEYLIKTYSNEGDTILDNCMGSGTTAIACINLNRNFIGFEIEEKYFKIANQRIEEIHNMKIS